MPPSLPTPEEMHIDTKPTFVEDKMQEPLAPASVGGGDVDMRSSPPPGRKRGRDELEHEPVSKRTKEETIDE
jgi:hypothetical protein